MAPERLPDGGDSAVEVTEAQRSGVMGPGLREAAGPQVRGQAQPRGAGVMAALLQVIS